MLDLAAKAANVTTNMTTVLMRKVGEGVELGTHGIALEGKALIADGDDDLVDRAGNHDRDWMADINGDLADDLAHDVTRNGDLDDFLTRRTSNGDLDLHLALSGRAGNLDPLDDFTRRALDLDVLDDIARRALNLNLLDHLSGRALDLDGLDDVAGRALHVDLPNDLAGSTGNGNLANDDLGRALNELLLGDDDAGALDLNLLDGTGLNNLHLADNFMRRALNGARNHGSGDDVDGNHLLGGDTDNHILEAFNTGSNGGSTDSVERTMEGASKRSDWSNGSSEGGLHGVNTVERVHERHHTKCSC
jgi:hypothetical protein